MRSHSGYNSLYLGMLVSNYSHNTKTNRDEALENKATVDNQHQHNNAEMQNTNNL